MRTWTSFPPSLLPLPHALAAGAVLGILPAPSSSHNPPGWALFIVSPDGSSQLSALGTLASLESLETLTFWAGH